MVGHSHTLANHFSFFINILYLWKTKFSINQLDSSKKTKTQKKKKKKKKKKKNQPCKEALFLFLPMVV